ncbi:hypothetical protein BZG36_05131 [Bifiguratus adelaidae]|uniref:Indoleamine 2,3-dioxygenase n=1 Tax=Bifiguratus adelaidae TaxID=1938954 RepID=A0A261XUD1_9FUNG|nr:hypothetical protein BZG36_05131 [Bifiguratus adelaidae]
MPSVTPLPCLQDYEISPRTGFLPDTPPLRRLTDPYYAPWEEAIDDFNGLLLAGRLRERVRKIPLLDIDRLTTRPEQHRAFLILAILSHGYVWGKHEIVSETLPACLAVPWMKVAQELEMCPVVCHAAVVLWNWRLLFEDGPIDLSNLATLMTYSGSVDESWFYLVTTAMEAAGAPALPAIISAMQAVRDNDKQELLASLRIIETCTESLVTTFMRMYEKTDPYVFYWKIRPYLAGWENMAEAGLPLGLIYEGVDTLWTEGTDEYADMSHLSDEERRMFKYRKYAGGSAAQSSLIHALDIAFGVEHYPTRERRRSKMGAASLGIAEKKLTAMAPVDNQKECEVIVDAEADVEELNSIDRNDRYNNMPAKIPIEKVPAKPSLDRRPSAAVIGVPADIEPPKPTRNNFIQTMRQYMPGPHRRFLQHLQSCANLRPYILNLSQKIQQEASEYDDIDQQVLDCYNSCLENLKRFRDKHVQVVSLYIVNQAKKGPRIAHGGFAVAKGTDASQNQEFVNGEEDASNSGDEAGPTLFGRMKQALNNVFNNPEEEGQIEHSKSSSASSVESQASSSNLSQSLLSLGKRSAQNVFRHNFLYPQTALFTNPVRENGTATPPPAANAGAPSEQKPSAALDAQRNKLPTLGLARHVDPDSKVVRGTGGTNVLPFLQQSRDETAATRVLQ